MNIINASILTEKCLEFVLQNATITIAFFHSRDPE